MVSVWRLMCPAHKIELQTEKMISFSKDGVITRCPMFFCKECEKYYIHTDAVSRNQDLDYGSYKVRNIENKPYQVLKEESNKGDAFFRLMPEENRKSSDEIKQFLDRFENCEANYKKDFPYSLLHYAFLFRRFDAVERIKCAFTEGEWEKALHWKGEKGFEWITPLVCAKWNLNYLYAYDDKNGTNLVSSLEAFLDEVDSIEEVVEYTDLVDQEGHSIFDIVWKQEQPLLDVFYYEKQELASKQIKRNKVSVVMDEVGTGKTVSSFYAIQDQIQKNKKEHHLTKVLIVCPYQKREDWQSDIRRQLGRYAHIVEQGENGLMYQGDLKRVFFKASEEVIMIAGQKKGMDLEGSYTALKKSIESYSKNERWDLVIIDESHLSFQNFDGITAKCAMLLTATPIVVNGKQERTFSDYLKLLGKITGESMTEKRINPIYKSLPTEQDIYVNWFREDMGKHAAERKIQFVLCKRHSDRNKIFDWIKERAGILTALTYDQDDQYLMETAIEQYDYYGGKKVQKNSKLRKLVELLKETKKSYLIFCEHQFVVELIFERLKEEFPKEIVAEKFGKFENHCGLGNVQDGLLIDTLVQALRIKKRVLFVTTGKTSGTGLNLGGFDGVIHYELPFTSIELEQRFGRVDRMDQKELLKSRDMIFLLNECKEDENDLEVNRMLYYCTTKIDLTCQFMPIRNTVLYYPEFIKRNGRAIRQALFYFQKEYVLSEENEIRIREVLRKRKIYESEIKESKMWEWIKENGRTVQECAKKALQIEKNDFISDAYYAYMEEYIEFLKVTKSERKEYERVYRQFLETKHKIKNWLAILGEIELEKESELFVGQNFLEEEEKVEKEMRKISSVQRQIKELMELVENSNLEDNKWEELLSDGIFCYMENRIRHASVLDYRSGKGWK